MAHRPQVASTKSGMVNIRPDEDETPENVLDGYDEHQQEEIRRMQQDPQVGGW